MANRASTSRGPDCERSLIKVSARRRRTWCLSVALALLPLAAASSTAPKLNVGDDPPDVFGKSSTGVATHLGDYRGKIVVVSFWATWCGPCRKELPVLIALQKHATREKVVVLSVNWRQSSSEFRQIKKLLKDTIGDVTLISDEYGLAGNAYGVKAIPHMIIIGRDGKIVGIHVGYSESEIPLLVDEINGAWLKETPDDAKPN